MDKLERTDKPRREEHTNSQYSLNLQAQDLLKTGTYKIATANSTDTLVITPIQDVTYPSQPSSYSQRTSDKPVFQQSPTRETNSYATNHENVESSKELINSTIAQAMAETLRERLNFDMVRIEQPPLYKTQY